MLTAMARELVTERGIRESANEVWRQIQAEHGGIKRPEVRNSRSFGAARSAQRITADERSVLAVLKLGLYSETRPA